MKIKELIKCFQQLIPQYETILLTKNYDLNDISNKHFANGICRAAIWKSDHSLGNVFDRYKGYYKNYIDIYGYLIGSSAGTMEGIRFRFKFIKSEVKELKKLLKQGYTHV